METPGGAVVAASPWKGWLVWACGGLGTAWAAYWHEAPALMLNCFKALIVLVPLESITANQMQRLAARRREQPRDDEPEIEVYPDDDWLRAWERLWNTTVYCILAAVADRVVGFPHYAVTIVVCTGTLGHIRAIARHIGVTSALRHFDTPDWIEDLLGGPPKRRRRSTED